jgi:hypothetical protein
VNGEKAIFIIQNVMLLCHANAEEEKEIYVNSILILYFA